MSEIAPSKITCDRCGVSYSIRYTIAHTRNKHRFRCEVNGCTRIYREDTRVLTVDGYVKLYQTPDDIRDTRIAAKRTEWERPRDEHGK